MNNSSLVNKKEKECKKEKKVKHWRPYLNVNIKKRWLVFLSITCRSIIREYMVFHLAKNPKTKYVTYKYIYRNFMILSAEFEHTVCFSFLNALGTEKII